MTISPINIQLPKFNYKEPFAKQLVEHELNLLRKEKGLKLEDIKVLSVEKEKRPELKFPGVTQEAKPIAFIEVPITVHRKVLDVIRMKLWNKGEGIAVRFEVNRYLPSSKISADNDYLSIA